MSSNIISKEEHIDITVNKVIIDSQEYQRLWTENLELKKQIQSFEHNEKKLLEEIDFHKRTIDELRKENEMLKKELANLKEKFNTLEKEHNILKSQYIAIKNRNDKFDALVKLNECYTLVNIEFKKQYKLTFKPKRNEYVPNIGEIINEPPTKESDEEYSNFWEKFKTEHPGSDRQDFRKIYQRISSERANSGAHLNVKRMTEQEVDECFKLVYEDNYEEMQQCLIDCRKWLFSF